jgi:hypothetical protein
LVLLQDLKVHLRVEFLPFMVHIRQYETGPSINET